MLEHNQVNKFYEMNEHLISILSLWLQQTTKSG